MSDVKVIQHETYRGTEVVLARTRGLCSEAELAARMIERWGCVAGEMDGEDSAGRQKIRLATADELVGRACDVAAKMFEEFTKRGWVVDIPLPVYTKEE
jgi:hypothetical protein